MSDKLLAGLVTAAGIAPLCAVCVLGPTAVGAMIAGAFGWIAGAGPLLIIGLMVAVGLLVYRDFRRRREVNRACGQSQGAPQLSTKNSDLRAPATASDTRSVQEGESS